MSYELVNCLNNSQVINSSKHSNYKFTGCNNCIKCCDGHWFGFANTHIFEFSRISNHFPIIINQTNLNFPIRLIFTIRRNIPCPYLDKDNKRCLIYNQNRPDACRNFPFELITDNNCSDIFLSTRVDQILSYKKCTAVSNAKKGLPIFNSVNELSSEILHNFYGSKFFVYKNHYFQETRIFFQFLKKIGLVQSEKYIVGSIINKNKNNDKSDAYVHIEKVNEKALKALNKNDKKELIKRGYLELINIHLKSLKNYKIIINTLLKYKHPEYICI